jgi:outer membrane protein assembly factor BamB/predicted MPP superfamily phosphohydrolase
MKTQSTMKKWSMTLLLCLFAFAGTTAKTRRCIKLPHLVPQATELKIAFLTDVHVTPMGESDSLLRVAVEEINNLDCDFVLVGGDLCNMGSDKELLRVRKILGALRKPWYAVPGNHETTWSESACATFGRLYGNDGKVAFRAGNYLFVCFTAGPYMKMADGSIRREDLNWVEKQFQAAREGERIVTLCHYPLSNDLTNRTAVTSLLNRYDVKFDMCGHYHTLRLCNFDSIPGLMGRALIQHDKQQGTTVGYNLVRVWADSVALYEKLLGQTPRLAYAVKQGNSAELAQLPCDPAPASLSYASTGAQLIVEEQASIYTGVAVAGDVIYYGTSLGELKAYDTYKKQTVWSQHFGNAIYSTPLCAEGVVVAGDATGALWGFDATQGKRLWKITCASPVVGDGTIVDGWLYMGLGSGVMAKINLHTGKVAWQYQFGEGQPQGRPAVADSRVVFGAWNTHLYCLDAQTGQLVWNWTNGSTQKLFSPGHIVPRVAGGRVFIVAPDRYMTAIDLQSGRQLWRIKQRKVRETTGINADGTAIYAKTMDGEMLAVSSSAEQYEELWLTDAGWGYDHNPCPIEVRSGVAYMANRTGCVAAVRENGTLLWAEKFASSAANDFYIDAKNRLWVTFIEGRIYCLGDPTTR